MTNKLFLCEWDSGSYGDVEPEECAFNEFSDDRGYDELDRELIDGLEVGESVTLGAGDHTVKRIEDY